MPSLAELPGELITEIALWVHSPLTVDEYDLRCGEGIFMCLAGKRKEHQRSLKAFGATCRSIRAAVRPILFRCVDINTVGRGETIQHADWRHHVRILKFSIYSLTEALPDVWSAPNLICDVLRALPCVEHLEFDVDVDVLSMLAILGERLFPSGKPIPSTEHFMSGLKSLSIRFTGDWSSSIDPLSYGSPFLRNSPNLQFLLVEANSSDHAIPPCHMRRYLPPSIIGFSAKGNMFYDLAAFLDGFPHCPKLKYLYLECGELTLAADLAQRSDTTRPSALEIFFFGGAADKDTVTILAEQCPRLRVIGVSDEPVYWLIDRSASGPPRLRHVVSGYRPGATKSEIV